MPPLRWAPSLAQPPAALPWLSRFGLPGHRRGRRTLLHASADVAATASLVGTGWRECWPGVGNRRGHLRPPGSAKCCPRICRHHSDTRAAAPSLAGSAAVAVADAAAISVDPGRGSRCPGVGYGRGGTGMPCPAVHGPLPGSPPRPGGGVARGGFRGPRRPRTPAVWTLATLLSMWTGHWRPADSGELVLSGHPRRRLPRLLPGLPFRAVSEMRLPHPHCARRK